MFDLCDTANVCAQVHKLHVDEHNETVLGEKTDSVESLTGMCLECVRLLV